MTAVLVLLVWMSWKCQDMVEIPYAWEVVAVKLGCPGSIGTFRMSWHTHECLCVQRTFWNCPGTLGHPGHKDMSACVYQDILDTRTWVLVCTNLHTIKVLRITDCNLLVRTLWASVWDRTTSPYAGSVHLREAVDANCLTAAASRLMCAHICLMIWLQRVISRHNVIWLKFRGWTGQVWVYLINILPAGCEVQGQLVLRLLCVFHVCIYICVSVLITCTIITSHTLMHMVELVTYH